MSASTGDKITDTRNAARPNSARATGTRSAAGVSLACDNLAGWPTASKVHFVTYPVDSSSNPLAGKQLDCSGIVSGNTITSFTVIDGSDLGNAVGDYVEMLPTAAWGQDLSDVLVSTHNRSGGLKTGITIPSPIITTPTLTTPTSTNGTFTTPTLTSPVFGGTATGSLTAAVLYSPYKFSVYRTAAQNTTGGAFTLVPFDTKTFDTGTNVDVATNKGRFTAPIAGFYYFDSLVTFNVAATQIYDAGLYKNGTILRHGTAGFSTSAGVTYYGVRTGGLISLAANDYIEIFSYANTTTEAITVGASTCYFDGFLVSAS